MKRLTLVTLALIFSILSYSQIEIDASGKVGIGGVTPENDLHLKDNGSAIMQFENGNGYSWKIGNYTSSPWSAVNTLAICTESNYPRMEFREDHTYIHDRLALGVGYDGNRAVFELDDQKWMRINAKDNSSGILFYETGSSSKNSVQYGGKIEYNENTDAFIIGTYQNHVAQNGIYLYRNNGNVGINGFNDSWTYKLKVFGAAYATSVWQTSDVRFKEDIKDLNNSFEQLKKVRGVTYKMKKTNKTNEIDSNNWQITSTDTIPTDSILADTTINMGQALPELKYGFIAQEIQEIFPDLVHADNDDYLAINYTGFIPLLVEAFKEQQLLLEKMQKEISNLKKKDSKKGGTMNSNSNQNGGQNTLFQNVPNPFTASTQIEYFIIDIVQNAMLNIYNMNGTQLKSIKLYQKGYGDITINGSEFVAGMYIYALIADGQVIDTKQMILTD